MTNPRPLSNRSGRRRLDATGLARVAVFAAIVAVLGLPGGFTVAGGVPITVQTLGVMLAGAILGPWLGALSMTVLLALVAIGLPLLAGGRGGIGVFFGPSAGYLLGWIVGAFVIGLIVHAGGRKPVLWRTALGMSHRWHPGDLRVGIPVQSMVTRLPIGETVLTSLAFVPGDLIKAVTATIIVMTLVRAYPRAFGRAWASTDGPGAGARLVIIPVSGGEPGLLEHLAADTRGRRRPPRRRSQVADGAWDAMVAAATKAELPDGTAWATLTSGSSGAPRIVLRSAESWSDSFAAVSGFLDAGHGENVALPAPPASSLTLFSLAHALSGGPRPMLRVTPDADALHGTPQALRAVLDAGAPPRLRAALIGGSHLDPALRAACRGRRYPRDGLLRCCRAVLRGLRRRRRLAAVPRGRCRGPGRRAVGALALHRLRLCGRARSAAPDGEWATVGDRAELSTAASVCSAGPTTRS